MLGEGMVLQGFGAALREASGSFRRVCGCGSMGEARRRAERPRPEPTTERENSCRVNEATCRSVANGPLQRMTTDKTRLLQRGCRAGNDTPLRRRLPLSGGARASTRCRGQTQVLHSVRLPPASNRRWTLLRATAVGGPAAAGFQAGDSWPGGIGPLNDPSASVERPRARFLRVGTRQFGEYRPGVRQALDGR